MKHLRKAKSKLLCLFVACIFSLQSMPIAVLGLVDYDTVSNLRCEKICSQPTQPYANFFGILNWKQYDKYSKVFDISTPTIQQIFAPIDTAIMMQGEAVPARLYPFGRIADQEATGIANFVIFMETEQYYIEQSDNWLRLSSVPPLLPAFLEITQVPDITVNEMVYQIKNEIDFDTHEANEFFRHNPPTKDFPFTEIGFFDVDDIGEDTYFIWDWWNTPYTRIFVRDNLQDGVFVVTIQHGYGAISGFGVRFRHYISTLKTLGLCPRLHGRATP